MGSAIQSDQRQSAVHELSADPMEQQASRSNRRQFLCTTTQGLMLAAAGGTLTSGLGLSDRAVAADDPVQKPLSVCLISGSVEYKSDQSLAALEPWLAERFGVRCTRAFRRADDDLPGLENLDNCDVMLLFTRRLTIDGEQLARVKKYCEAGRPIVGVRTASHAFQNWLALDREVFGGNYKGHYQEGPETEIRLTAKAAGDPLLKGFTPFRSAGSLYRNAGLADDCRVLLTGSIPEHTEPIAWVREHRGGRVFYSSLGHPKDFEVDAFRQLLANALFWTARRLG
jgi:type 1 glutamine amidotransferase